MSSQPANNLQFLRTPVLTLIFSVVTAGVLALLPWPVREYGMWGLMCLGAGVVALCCTAVHPLVPFTCYLATLFFADTKVPGLPLPAGQAAGLLLLFSLVAYVLRGRAMKLRSGFLPVLTAVAVYFTIRAITGEDVERSLVHFRYVIIYFLIAIGIAASLTTERSIYAFCWIIVGLTALAAVHGLYQAVEKDVLGAFTGHWSAANRVQGTAKNPIVFGWNMVFAFPFAFFLYAQHRTSWARAAALVCGLLCVFTATFTFNRQTYVLIGVLAVMAGMLYRYQGRKLLLTLGAVVMGVAAVTVLPRVLLRVSTVGTLARDYSFLERRDSFLVGMQMFDKHPFFGVGLGSYPGVWKEYIPPDYTTFYVQYMPATQLRYTDFGYLNMLVEGGLVGLGLFCTLLLAWLLRAYKFRREAVGAGDKLAQNLASTVLSVGVFVALSSAIQDTFLYTRVWIAFALVLLVDKRMLPLREEVTLESGAQAAGAVVPAR